MDLDPELQNMGFSTRTLGFLTRKKVFTIPQFMKIEKVDVDLAQNAGSRTWEEILHAQSHLTRSGGEYETNLVKKINELNVLLSTKPSTIKIEQNKDGLFEVYQRLLL